jgi:hypothetical protein
LKTNKTTVETRRISVIVNAVVKVNLTIASGNEFGLIENLDGDEGIVFGEEKRRFRRIGVVEEEGSVGFPVNGDKFKGIFFFDSSESFKGGLRVRMRGEGVRLRLRGEGVKCEGGR